MIAQFQQLVQIKPSASFAYFFTWLCARSVVARHLNRANVLAHDFNPTTPPRHFDVHYHEVIYNEY